MPSLVESTGSMEVGRTLISFHGPHQTCLYIPQVLPLHSFPKRAAQDVILLGAEDQSQSSTVINEPAFPKVGRNEKPS